MKHLTENFKTAKQNIKTKKRAQRLKLLIKHSSNMLKKFKRKILNNY